MIIGFFLKGGCEILRFRVRLFSVIKIGELGKLGSRVENENKLSKCCTKCNNMTG